MKYFKYTKKLYKNNVANTCFPMAQLRNKILDPLHTPQLPTSLFSSPSISRYLPHDLGVFTPLHFQCIFVPTNNIYYYFAF